MLELLTYYYSWTLVPINSSFFFNVVFYKLQLLWLSFNMSHISYHLQKYFLKHNISVWILTWGNIRMLFIVTNYTSTNFVILNVIILSLVIVGNLYLIFFFIMQAIPERCCFRNSDDRGTSWKVCIKLLYLKWLIIAYNISILLVILACKAVVRKLYFSLC